MRAKEIIVGAAIIAAIAASGCTHFIRAGKTVNGGPSVNDTRAVASFNQIRLEGAADITWKPNTTVSVTVSGPSNPVKIIETKVENGCLVISMPEHVSTNDKITITAASPSLESVELFGAGNINIEGIAGPSFKAKVNGAGTLTAKGSAEEAEFDVSGASSVSAKDLKAKEASASISGAGDIDLFASSSLSASISGAGNINYYGNPPKVSKSVSGAGSIEPK